MAIHKSELNTGAVEVEGISKRFGDDGRPNRLMPWRKVKKPKLALDQVSLHVETGRITGILGANGSGKSTLIRILATLLTPDEGTASVFGYDVVSQPDDVRRHINRVSVEASFFKEMSHWENMLYAARLYGSGGGGTRARVEGMLGRLGLPVGDPHHAGEAVARGQEQKTAMARSLLDLPA